MFPEILHAERFESTGGKADVDIENDPAEVKNDVSYSLHGLTNVRDTSKICDGMKKKYLLLPSPEKGVTHKSLLYIFVLTKDRSYSSVG